MKRTIGYFKTQDGILFAALALLLGGSALSLLHAFSAGTGPATLVAPFVVAVS